MTHVQDFMAVSFPVSESLSHVPHTVVGSGTVRAVLGRRTRHFSGAAVQGSSRPRQRISSKACIDRSTCGDRKTMHSSPSRSRRALSMSQPTPVYKALPGADKDGRFVGVDRVSPTVVPSVACPPQGNQRPDFPPA